MFTRYHSKYAARRLLLDGQDDAAFAKSLSTARVDMKPHQVDAALFALHSPLARGAILADEVGLGKTIEASLVIAQRWAERRRHILLVVPASLRKQWAQELREKFSLASVILEARSYSDAVKAGQRPFHHADKVVITSYEFAARKAADLKAVAWDLVVFDEAHRLRNVYKRDGSVRAKDLKEALSSRFKLLLTATPLQNSLLELYGLVSMIDDTFFGGEESFKLLYGRKPDRVTLAGLRQRLAPIYKRHLRRDVQAAGHVAFTERKVLTLDFEPAEQEVMLYDALSAYLQRAGTVAFGDPPNPLVLTVARKVLGSSTVAIVQFLETILKRLRARQALDLASLDDIDGADDLASEESGDDPAASRIRRPHAARRPADEEGEEDGTLAGVDPVVLAREVMEVEGYLNLARSIGSNAKGDKLVSQLTSLLDEVVANGGRRKAVVFTESVRTQGYLADLLSRGGHEGRIVLLNGSNADPASGRLYRAWAERHAGTEAVSGSKGADMKAAIVEAFRGDDATILLATESGAEGINLQFCSLVVNFDLPWNPQRVEQRIGRCHRYGQRLDVTVINFLNRRNKAEERVYELLRDKFHLFQGVFGASDGVLGVIESGVDFERAVLGIVQSCRTDAEIVAAFKKLEEDLDERIASDMEDARRKVFDTLDQGIVQRLQARGQAIDRALSDFERRLSMVARVELPEARFHDEIGPRFDLGDQTWTTEWPLADERGWQFFRLGDKGLATEVVERARDRDLLPGRIVFDPEALRRWGLPGFADVDGLRGRSGWMRVSCLTLGTQVESGQPRQAFVVAATTDDGNTVASDTVERLFFVPGAYAGPPEVGPPLERLDALERADEAFRVEEARNQNARWLDEENERLDAQADDLTRAADERAKALDAEARAARKALRTNATITLEDKIKEQRRVAALEKERDTIRLETFTRQSALRQQVQDNLDQIAASLAITPSLDPLFTVRWEVAA